MPDEPVSRARILVVDDEQSIREFLSICLNRAGHDTACAATGADALRMLSTDERGFDVVITDLSMPGVDGMEVLRHACALPLPPPVVMMTAFATTDTAITAMKLGAHDYLTKPFKVAEIEVVVERAIERTAMRAENIRLKAELKGVHQLDNMVGRSESMQKVFDLIRRVANTRTNVLIRGESGTGKELVARALHNLSDRAARPFIAINCGAIPATLMESELFGHIKGAFTGATTTRPGVFQAAQGGTLFLDEVGDLDIAMQVKLLRVLQERTVRPVGAIAEIDLDLRLITATHRDLEAAISAGEFRQDLYFRLNVIQIVLPPLRHRREDIPILVERFFRRYNVEMGRGLSGIAPSAHKCFLNYDYPGNIRELENLVERAVALEGGSDLGSAHLTELSQGTSPVLTTDTVPNSGLDLDAAVADLERRLIESALIQAKGVRKRAADLLSISLRSLRYRLQKLGIEVSAATDEDTLVDPRP